MSKEIEQAWLQYLEELKDDKSIVTDRDKVIGR
jgi:hypothetical protein